MGKPSRYTEAEIRHILLTSADENNVVPPCNDFDDAIAYIIRNFHGGWNNYCKSLGLIPFRQAPTKVIKADKPVHGKPIPRNRGDLRRALGVYDVLDYARERGA